MRDGKQNPTISKKRTLDQSALPTQNDLAPMASRSHPDVSTISQEPPQIGIQRASTFPKLGSSSANASNSSLENSWSQSGSSYGAQTPTSAPYDASTFAAASQRNKSQAGGGIPPYSMGTSLANPALADLSSMMFPPAEEPFGYPNQPLTTFENNQQYNKNSIYPSSQVYNSIGNASPVAPPSRGGEENIEAQFYPLPPYIEQRQQQRQQPMPLQSQRVMGFGPSMGYGAGQAQSGTAAQAMQIPNGGWAGQQPFQQDLSDININGLFGGGEWLPPGYPTYQGGNQ